MNTDGTSVLSQTHYLTNQFGRLRDLCIGAEKEIYLATNGSSWSNTSPNTHSIIVIRPPNSGVGIGDNWSNDFTVYPHPFDNLFTVDFPAHLVGNEFSLIDLMGRTISSSTIK